MIAKLTLKEARFFGSKNKHWAGSQAGGVLWSEAPEKRLQNRKAMTGNPQGGPRKKVVTPTFFSLSRKICKLGVEHAISSCRGALPFSKRVEPGMGGWPQNSYSERLAEDQSALAQRKNER